MLPRPNSKTIAFFATAQSGNLTDLETALENILTAGISIDVVDQFGCTALMRAVNAEDLNKTNLLLEHGADPLPVSKNGHGAIHFAVRHGNLEIVKTLVKNNLTLVNNTNSTLRNWTPLHFAAQENFVSIAQHLILNGADTSLSNEDNNKAVDLTTSEEMRDLLNSQETSIRVTSAIPLAKSAARSGSR